MSMRLAEFIREEVEPILQNWEDYAKSILNAERLDKIGLRDHAREMLLAIAHDLETPQNKRQQAEKSQGDGPQGQLDTPAEVHGGERHATGFSILETVSEFRALRASVVSLWTKAYPEISGVQLEDLTRFHEAIDQAVAESLEHYTNAKEIETRLFGAVLVASPDPIFVLDLEGRFSFANKATADLFALETDSIIGQSTQELGFSFASDMHDSLEKVIADRSIYRGKFVHKFASGHGERFDYLLAPVLDEDESIEAIVCIFRDVTEQALAEEKVWHSAYHDQLTGLPNRRLFLDRLEREVKHAKRSNQSLAVLFMDLDGFKEVNDSFGHEAGDRLLTDVAKRLTDCVREEDTVARLGGDEFLVIFSGLEQRKDAELVAQSIVDALAMPFAIARRSIYITVSIGISLYPEDATSPEALLKAADQAMYTTKRADASQAHR